MKKRKIQVWLAAIIYFILSLPCFADLKVIHVLVALCDNKYQKIAPVPKAIGNGQDPKNNLYWGAAYGFKTYFAKQKEWQVVQINRPKSGIILEEIIYKHQDKDVYLIAQAYNGKYINDTVDDFIDYSAGKKAKAFKLNNKMVMAGEVQI